VSGPDDSRSVRGPVTLKASDSVGHEIRRRVTAPYRPVLVVMSGNDVGLRVTLDRTLLVGRDPEADVVLSDALVSWHHARIEDRGDSWTLVDLGSTNGTTLNGEACGEGVLQAHDKIVFGSTILRFELQDGVEQAYNQVVDRMLNIDDLSGLYVRRKFDAELATMIDAARREPRPVSLLVIDLDGVKGINDTHGHLFGAYVIGESGRVIGQVIGPRGIACRFGGDEFLAALPGLEVDAAAEVAEQIRQAINEHAFERERIVLKPGISIGVAAFDGDGGVAELFQRADEALYRAKQSGKNRVCR
jgi:diguanylate cyclase (GGDEF)-like protein